MVQSIKENEGQGESLTRASSKQASATVDSLIFEQQHLEALRLYIQHVRPHFEDNSEDILWVTHQTIEHS